MRSVKANMVMRFLSIIVMISTILLIVGYATSVASMTGIRDHQLEVRLDSDLNVMREYVRSFYGDIRSNKGILVDKNYKDIEGDTQLVDNIGNNLGDLASIMIRDGNKFKSIATSIVDEKGNRMVGTYIEDDDITQSLLNGNRSIGNSEIGGTIYHTVYSPIFEHEEVIGAIF